MLAVRDREAEIVEMVCLGGLGLGSHAKYRVDKTGMKLIEGSWPTREQFEAAYQASQRERFDPKGIIGGTESLPRSEKILQCKLDQLAESDQPPIVTPVLAPQKIAVDPLAAVHRRRYKG
jgi:hypothetical protein